MRLRTHHACDHEEPARLRTHHACDHEEPACLCTHHACDHEEPARLGWLHVAADQRVDLLVTAARREHLVPDGDAARPRGVAQQAAVTQRQHDVPQVLAVHVARQQPALGSNAVTNSPGDQRGN